REVIVTGLFGIDAEHMSSRLLNAEIHPVYAMAVRTSDPPAVDSDTWVLFARDSANEGFCSHQGRAHVLHWPDQRYQVELPIYCTKQEVKATYTFCSRGKGTPEVSVTIDPHPRPHSHRVSLVNVLLPSEGIVEGEIRFECSGPEISAREKTLV